MIPDRTANIDRRTVEGFGEEWAAFTQEELGREEQQRLFDQYFSLFPFDRLSPDAEGFDLGCGTGRWAALVAERVGRLHCIDPAAKALAVARRRLASAPNVAFHKRDVDRLPMPDGSQDFGYSIGVLHHIPDTGAALARCVAKLKPRAPFLVYIYYAFDNRPAWFRSIWKVSEIGRSGISRLPFGPRKAITGAIAALIYWPLARAASAAERLGRPVGNWPLAEYRYRSFYSMRTDALDR
ncbi:MAG TPA: class I SAM-dependent methyltransferase, partial [Sphingomicrobium sp.]|nr:class I SAM-dependent methyltransferase [Sphingomicrobium sp.]